MEEQIKQALKQGMKPEEILTKLVEQGMSQEDATKLIQSVMQSMQGGEGGEGGKPSAITAEEAAEAFAQLGMTPEQIIAAIQIVTNMSPSSLDQLLGGMEKGRQGGQGGQPEQENY